jgi:AAA+ superfamily predicted ATPase
MIEQDESHSLIVAATNHPEILDHALFRRFDDILRHDLPDEASIAELLKSRLGKQVRKGTSWKRLAAHAQGLSYAEIVRACDEGLKELVIEQKERISEADIRRAVDERVHAKSRFLAKQTGT